MIFLTRSDWHAAIPRYPFTRLVDSAGIVVHHLGDGLTPKTDPARAMLDVQGFHMRPPRGWNDFAYGWAVGAGQIFEGRGWGWVDGADTGIGRIMHSVLWLGDSNIAAPPPEDLAAIAAVIEEHARRYPRVASVVVGHGDINATTCPGGHLRSWLSAGRPAPGRPAPVAPHTRKANNMHILTNLDGRREAFALGGDGIARMRYQPAPGAPFGDWAPIAPSQPVAGSLFAEVAADGRLAVTVSDAAYGQLFGSWQTAPGAGPWSEWFNVNDLLSLLAG